MLHHFDFSCNAYKDGEANRSSPLVPIVGEHASGWRSDYRFRRLWEYYKSTYKSVSARNQLYWEDQLKSCTDQEQSFEAFMGQYRQISAKLTELGVVIGAEHHRINFERNLTNPHLQQWKNDFASGQITLVEMETCCNGFLTINAEKNTPLMSSTSMVAGRAVTIPFVRPSEDPTCWRCGRVGLLRAALHDLIRV